MSAAVTRTAAVVAANMTFAMVMVVMAALHIGIEVQFVFQESSHSGIRISGYSAIKLDTCRRQSSLSATADTAADQNIGTQRIQDSGQRAVSASVGVHNLGSNHTSILYVIDLELCGVTKVLENLSVLVSNCNSHSIFSFRFFILLTVKLFETAVMTTILVLSVAKPEITTLDSKRAAVHDAISQFLSRDFINPLDSRSGDLHECSALFLTESLFVDQTNRFIFINSHKHRFFFHRCIDR